MLRQARVVMTAQKAQADVLLHRLHYALLPGWDAAAERRDAQDELHSAAATRSRAPNERDTKNSTQGRLAVNSRPLVVQIFEPFIWVFRQSGAPNAGRRTAARRQVASPSSALGASDVPQSQSGP